MGNRFLWSMFRLKLMERLASPYAYSVCFAPQKRAQDQGVVPVDSQVAQLQQQNEMLERRLEMVSLD